MVASVPPPDAGLTPMPAQELYDRIGIAAAVVWRYLIHDRDARHRDWNHEPIANAAKRASAMALLPGGQRYITHQRFRYGLQVCYRLGLVVKGGRHDVVVPKRGGWLGDRDLETIWLRRAVGGPAPRHPGWILVPLKAKHALNDPRGWGGHRERSGRTATLPGTVLDSKDGIRNVTVRGPHGGKRTGAGRPLGARNVRDGRNPADFPPWEKATTARYAQQQSLWFRLLERYGSINLETQLDFQGVKLHHDKSSSESSSADGGSPQEIKIPEIESNGGHLEPISEEIKIGRRSRSCNSLYDLLLVNPGPKSGPGENVQDQKAAEPMEAPTRPAVELGAGSAAPPNQEPLGASGRPAEPPGCGVGGDRAAAGTPGPSGEVRGGIQRLGWSTVTASPLGGETLRAAASPRRTFVPPLPGQRGVPRAPHSIPFAVTPQAPFLPADAPPPQRLRWLRWAYCGALRDPKTRREPFVPDAVLERNRAALLDAAQTMIARGIAPAEWAAWSVRVWFEHLDDRGKDPPFAWVWRADRMIARQGMFAHSGPGLGGRAIFGKARRELMERHRAMREEIWRAKSQADVDFIVNRLLPAILHCELSERAANEAKEIDRKLRELAQEGQWIW